MKKSIILFLILCSFSTVRSQDCFKELQKQNVANDSLKKWITANDKNQQLIKKSLQDSISKLTDALNKTKTEFAAANKKITELDKNSVKKERDELKKQIDDLTKKNENTEEEIKKKNAEIAKQKAEMEKQKTEKEKEIAEKEKQIVNIKTESSKKELQKFAEGQQSVHNLVIQFYKKPFDDLIKLSTKQSVENDLTLINNSNNDEAKKKLHDLQKYFDAEQVLVERYNEQKVKNALGKLKDIKQQSEFVKKSIDKLEDYKLCNDALRDAINKIDEMDKKIIAKSDYAIEKKLLEISSYIYNYHFNLGDYQYLADIILEIINRKQKDANADIKDLLNKL